MAQTTPLGLAIAVLVGSALGAAVLAWFLLFRKPAAAGREGFEGEAKRAELRMYVAEWCGFCKKFAPERAKIEKRAASLDFDVRTIDSETLSTKQLQDEGVEGFPTIMLVMVDGAKEIYTGERTADKIIAWAKALLD